MMVEKTWTDSPELQEYFPDVSIDIEPVADLVCFQVKMPKRRVGSIIVSAEGQEFDRWNTMIAKVIKVGPVAFKDADTLKEWPEGPWAEVGDYVVIPKYGAVKFGKSFKDKHGNLDKCLFAFLRAKDIRAKITGNPLEVEEYV